MMKKALTILFTAALSCPLMAQSKQVFVIKAGKSVSINTGTPFEQKEIGQAVMEFMYDYKYQTDTTDLSLTEDRMTLQVGNGISKFSSYTAMRIDSLIRISTPEQITANPDSYVGGEAFSIYKNYPKGRISVTDKISTDWFLYEEETPVMDWTLSDSTCTLLGYPCKSAFCDFRGRRWTAFYTDAIPVPNGPWKFGGLPGLILQVYDEGQQYVFTCVGINSQAQKAITMPDVPYNKTSRRKFYTTKHRCDTDPVGYISSMNSSAQVKVEIKGPDGQPRTDLMSPKALKYDYIERDWK